MSTNQAKEIAKSQTTDTLENSYQFKIVKNIIAGFLEGTPTAFQSSEKCLFKGERAKWNWDPIAWFKPMGTSLIEIDGAEKSGSGTLVRFAVALCSLANQPMRMVRIREKREKRAFGPSTWLPSRLVPSLRPGGWRGPRSGPGKSLIIQGQA